MPSDEPMSTPNLPLQANSVSSTAGSSDMSKSPSPEVDSKVSEERLRILKDYKRKRRLQKSRKKYRKLYNSHVEEVNSSTSEDYDEHLLPSQLGTSIWSTVEKTLFFHVLARKGRHNIKAIATEVGSKSEPEIVQYIDMLSKGLADSELSVPRPNFVDRPQYDAALEISNDCTSQLEPLAQYLQKDEDKDIAKEMKGKLWLLTRETSLWVEECLQEAGEGDSEISQTLPAAAFLNLGQFLHLSKFFFMNSCDLECNWQSLTGKGGGNAPAITDLAFSDFHSLALNLTKRLVHTSLYIATSRLRAREVADHPPKHEMTKEDVFTAVNLLGMTKDSRSLWTGVARRHKLLVYENVNTIAVSGKHYSYDEIEEHLSGRSKASSKGSETLQDAGASRNDLESIPSDSQPGSGCDTDADMVDESDISERSSSIPSDEESPNKEEEDEQRRDDTLEKLDQRQSRAEEARLWEILGEEPSTKMGLEEDGSRRLQVQLAPRKNRMDVVDWTSWTDYGAEWETLETPVPEEGFRINRRLTKDGVVGESEG